jgi:molecular chaperone DnaK (HSP70)
VTHEKVRNRANRNNILENMEDMNANRKKTDFELRGKCQKDNMIHSIMTAEKVIEKDHWIDINIHLERESESVIKFFMEALEHHSMLHGEHQATIESRVAMIEVHDSRATQLRQKIALLLEEVDKEESRDVIQIIDDIDIEKEKEKEQKLSYFMKQLERHIGLSREECQGHVTTLIELREFHSIQKLHLSKQLRLLMDPHN